MRNSRIKLLGVVMFFCTLISFSNTQVYADPGGIDTDNDGVIDIVDLDDDNDGISDADESGIIPASGSPYIQDPFNIVEPGWYQNVNTFSRGQLYVFNIMLNDYVEVGDATNNGKQFPGVNGIGLNPVDGFMYGIATQAGTDTLGNLVAGGDLIRYDRDGELFHVGVPSGNGWNGLASGHYSADIYYNTADLSDPKNGTLWVRNGGKNDVAIIDTSNGVVLDSFTLTGTNVGVGADIINIDGVFMTIGGVSGDGNGILAKWDPRSYTIGSITTIPATDTTVTGFAAADNGTIGAGYGSKDPTTGEIIPYFSFNKTGAIYMLDQDTNQMTYIAQGAVTNSNDGAGSILAGVPVGDFFADTDYDGVYDMVDLDSDNDGISDLYEGGNPVVQALDTNGNGTIDSGDATGFIDDGSLPSSAAGNGIDDRVENQAGSPRKGIDPVNTSVNSGLNTPDYIDLDSDSDGIPDAIEAQPTVGYVGYAGNGDAADSDNDGILDVFEGSSPIIFGTNGHPYFSAPYDAGDIDTLPDYIDSNSDADDIYDVDEKGVVFTDISYGDPDSFITDSASLFSNMKNLDSDPGEVDFRSSRLGASYFGHNEFWCRSVGVNINDPDANGGQAVVAYGANNQGGSLGFGKIDDDLELGASYKVQYRMKVSDNTDTRKQIVLDVFDPNTETKIATKFISASDFPLANEYTSFFLVFEQEHAYDYEFRIFYDESASYDLYADMVKVETENQELAYYNAGDFDTSVGTITEDVDKDGNNVSVLKVESTNQSGGALQFGIPGDTDLELGRDYLVHFELKVSDNSSNEEKILIDAYNHATGDRVFKTIKPSDFFRANEFQTFELFFNYIGPGYEFRVFYFPNANFDLTSGATVVTKLSETIKYHAQSEDMYTFIGEFVEDISADLGGALYVPSSNTTGGTLQFGPYETNLTQGVSYTANFKLKVSDNSSTEEKIYIDVFNGNIDHHEYLLISPSDFTAANTYQNFEVPFTRVVDDYEFRIFYLPNAGFDLYTDTLTVTQ